MKQEKVLLIPVLIILIILLLNVMFYTAFYVGFQPIVDLSNKGMIIKLKPIKYVIVLAHGEYISVTESTNNHITKHITKFKGEQIDTRDLLDDLYSQGYRKVWLSQCQTGNYDMMYYSETENTEWYPWVSRKTTPGRTYPIFIGVGIGFVRL